jgi:hypothetical protein
LRSPLLSRISSFARSGSPAATEAVRRGARRTLGTLHSQVDPSRVVPTEARDPRPEGRRVLTGRRHLGHERFARVTFPHAGPPDGSSVQPNVVQKPLGRRGFLLVDLDDHKAIGFLDDAPAGASAGYVAARDRPALGNVIGSVLFVPRHVDDGVAVGGSALAAPDLRRLPTGGHSEGVCRIRECRRTDHAPRPNAEA